MAEFGDFLRDLEGLAREHAGRGLALKVESDPRGCAVRVFGDGATPLSRARSGLADAVELAHATAEHHPLWGMLANSAEIAADVLERWDGDLSPREAEEIRWRIRELARSAERLPEGPGPRRDRA